MKAYHFTAKTLRDGRPLPLIGEWLEYAGVIQLCQAGLHASKHPFDALTYAPGPLLHFVELEGDLQDAEDKTVGRRRKILRSIDATNLLREFARWCALQVINSWDAPQIVMQYLETGDKNIRSAAQSAACSAACSAAESAADSAAWSAACSAACSAADQKQRQKFFEIVETVLGEK